MSYDSTKTATASDVAAAYTRGRADGWDACRKSIQQLPVLSTHDVFVHKLKKASAELQRAAPRPTNQKLLDLVRNILAPESMKAMDELIAFEAACTDTASKAHAA